MNFSSIFSGVGNLIIRPITQAIKSKFDYRKNVTTKQADVLVADAQGESWMQRTWRPFLGYTLTIALMTEFIIVRWLNIIADINGGNSIDYKPLSQEFWYLLLSVATVFGGARTGRYLMQASRRADKQELAMKKEETKQSKVKAKELVNIKRIEARADARRRRSSKKSKKS